MTKDNTMRFVLNNLVRFVKGESDGLLAVTELIDTLQKALAQETSSHSDHYWAHEIAMAHIWGFQQGRSSAKKEALAQPNDDHEFKNFHRVLCERFGYTHDEFDWKRDQVSLIEWISKQVAPEALTQPEPDPIAVVTGTHAGYFVVRPTDPAMVLPVNMALYTHPKEQPDADPTGWICWHIESLNYKNQSFLATSDKEMADKWLSEYKPGYACLIPFYAPKKEKNFGS